MKIAEATAIATRLREASSALLNAPAAGLTRLETDAKVRAQALAWEAFSVVANLASDLADKEHP